MHSMTRWRGAATAVGLAAAMWWLAGVGDASVGRANMSLVREGDGYASGATVGKNGEVGGLTAKFVEVDGVRTRYYDYGQGEPLVLVHGGGFGCCSSANNWARNIPALAKRFRVVALDRLAAGLTGNPKDDAAFGTEGPVRHVYQFIQTLKLGQVHLVGHSSGGALAFYLAMQHPEAVKTLTIVAHGPGMPAAGEGPTIVQPVLDQCPPDTSTPEHMMCRHKALAFSPHTFEAEDLEASAFLMTAPKWTETRTRLAALAASQTANQASESNRFRQQMWDRQRNEGTLQMPILIVAARQDKLSWLLNEPFAYLRGELGFFDIVAAKNPRVQMVIINGAGHYPYRDQPEQFNADLIQFIGFWKDLADSSMHTQR